MSYETAPVTRLVATHCCMCGKPLCDAKSLELGIGPICRKTVLKDNLVVSFDAQSVIMKALELGIDDARLTDRLLGEDQAEAARKAANWLLYYASANIEDVGTVCKVAHLLGLLGLKAVAKKLIGDRIPYLETEAKVVRASVSYSEVFNGYARKIGGSFDRATKTWVFPVENRSLVVQTLHMAYEAKLVGVDAEVFSADLTAEFQQDWQVAMIALSQPSKKASIRVVKAGDLLKVSSPFNQEFIAAAKDLGGRWGAAEKTWNIPSKNGELLKNVLRNCYKSELIQYV